MLIPATCAVPGTQSAKCRVCGVTDTTTLPTTENHSYAVTIQGCGYRDTQYNCTICGDTKVVNENLSCSDGDGDHICDISGCWVDCVDGNGDHVCDKCGSGV
ncbi:MAG: hypothetical protein IJ324_03265 [Lachnospiraceae bacterium]|nr:hypothetical protein [Lachnospiraceae bacterium]